MRASIRPKLIELRSLIGVAVTSATAVIHGQAGWDSARMLSRLGSPVSHVAGLVGLGLAALATSLAAPAAVASATCRGPWPPSDWSS